MSFAQIIVKCGHSWSAGSILQSDSGILVPFIIWLCQLQLEASKVILLVCIKPAKKAQTRRISLERISWAGLEMADIIFTHMLLARTQSRGHGPRDVVYLRAEEKEEMGLGIANQAGTLQHHEWWRISVSALFSSFLPNSGAVKDK